MANWSRPATISQLLLYDADDAGTIVNESRVDLSGGFISFEYYESLFSPHVTASISYIDTGYAVRGQSDVQERIGTVFNSSNDFKGKIVDIIISHESSSTGLNLANNPLEIVQSVSGVSKDKKRVHTFKLSSSYGVKNESLSVQKKYYNKISDTVQSILTDPQGLAVPTDRIIKDSTKNSEAFQGLGERPFHAITILARMSVPESGAPGYFFYETVDGFNFRAIDNLLSATPKGTAAYIYSDVGTFCNASNFRILEYTPPQETDRMSQIRCGLKDAELVTFDLSTFTCKINKISLEDTVSPTVGSNEFSEQDQTDKNDKTKTGRTFFQVVDSGNNEVGISTNINNDPKEWISSILRYNSLFFNSFNIVVPCNLNLRAGDLIQCQFPKLTQDPEQGVSDEKMSGSYLILHLSHKFTSDGQTGSTTHMTIVRDTNGELNSPGGN